MADGTYKPRVLVVDDDMGIRELLKIFLIDLGCEIVGEGTNGREAVEIFKEKSPDLIILDISMPILNGFNALKEIQGENDQSNVVMLTAVDDITMVDECLNAGAKDYLTKGVPPDELRNELQNLIENLNL